MSLVGKTLVKGHTLRCEGGAFVEDLCYTGGTRRAYGSRVGFALCSCGARSDDFDSNNKRKQWHREHKSDVLDREWSA